MSDLGYDGLLWFMGVVEDRDDPQRMGRVRVRCFNIHPQDKEAVPTDDLPWSYLISGTFTADVKPPKLNTWVFGFFVDGKDAQHPMIIGALNGMPTQLPKLASNGQIYSFGDVVDQDDMPDIYEPDMPKLARAEKIEETSVLTKNLISKEEFKTADGKGWNIPKSPYNAEYPHNRVYESSSGHVMEFDDTKGNERINIFHKEGTWIEIDSVGNMTIVSSGKKTDVSLKDSKVFVRGDQDITVEGNGTFYVQKNATMKIEGDLNATVKGDYNLNVGKTFNLNVRESIKIRGSNVLMEASTDNIETYAAVNNINYAAENYSIKSGLGAFINVTGGDLHLLAEENGYITTTSGALNLNSKTTMNVQSTADVDLKGANINLNTDGKGEADTALEALENEPTKLAEPPEGGNVVPAPTVEHESYGSTGLDDRGETTSNVDGYEEDVADYNGENGRLDPLTLTSIGKGHRLRDDAAQAYLAMVKAAAEDGISWSITDSYRTYEVQVRLAKEKGLYSQGGLAAKPGTSNHGWALAVDLGGGVNREGTPQNNWLDANAKTFGFFTIPREPWHWEFRGSSKYPIDKG